MANGIARWLQLAAGLVCFLGYGYGCYLATNVEQTAPQCGEQTAPQCGPSEASSHSTPVLADLLTDCQKQIDEQKQCTKHKEAWCSLELKNCIASQRIELENQTFRSISIESSFLRRGLNLDSVTVAGDVDLKSSVLNDSSGAASLSLRGAKLGALTIAESSLQRVDLPNLTVAGVLEIRDTELTKFELALAKVSAVEANNLRVVDYDPCGLNKYDSCGLNKKERFILRQSETNLLLLLKSDLRYFDFTSLVVKNGLDLTSSRWWRGEFNGVTAQAVKWAGAIGEDTDLMGSQIAHLDLTQGGSVRWVGGHVQDFHHDGRVGDGSSADSSLFSSCGRTDETAAVLQNFNAQKLNTMNGAFVVLEKSLRDAGALRRANQVHLQGLAHRARGSDGVERALNWLRLLYLDGVGDPWLYALVLLGLVFVGAGWPFALGKKNDLPQGVRAASDGKPSQLRVVIVGAGPGDRGLISLGLGQAADEKADSQGYSPFWMSLSTLLPGDTLNYLRNYRFGPQSTGRIFLVIGLQVLALFVQGLIVFALGTLMPR